MMVGSVGTPERLELRWRRTPNFFWPPRANDTVIQKFHRSNEDYWGHVNPIGPRGVYDEAKRFFRSDDHAYHRYHEVDTHIVRSSIPMGRGCG